MELIEIVDRDGNSTGQIMEKKLAHDLNLLHNEVGLFLINNQGQILLQKRSANKKFNPNKWGTCGGHVDVGEDNMTALVRETKEEIGIDLNPSNVNFLIKIVKERESNSHVSIYYYTFMDKLASEFVIQEEELSEVKWFDFKEYKDAIFNNDSRFTFSNNKENCQMLDLLGNVIGVK